MSGINNPGSMLQARMVFVSHGGKCFEYKVNSHNNILETTEPVYLQCQHEEADTLIAFHVKAVTGNVLVRSTDTGVLVILLRLVGRSERVIMDYVSTDAILTYLTSLVFSMRSSLNSQMH